MLDISDKPAGFVNEGSLFAPSPIVGQTLTTITKGEEIFSSQSDPAAGAYP